MARKKTAKRTAKRTTTRTTARTAAHSSSPALRMEKDFLGTPSKLSALLSKEIKGLKQRESKLKTTVAKSKTKVKLSEGKLKTAAKQKTPAGKKQLLIAKKAHGKTLQSHTALEKQLKDASQLLNTSTQKYAKFVALRKNLSQFEKDWNSKTRTKAKAKTKTKRHTLPKSKPDQQTQPQLDSYETVNDLFRIDESETTT